MRKLVLSLFAATVGAGLALADAGKYNKVVAPGDKAPAIAGVPAAAPGDKEMTLNLADIKEEVVVVTFLANHCPVVVAYEDRLIDLAKAYEGKSVKFVAICCTNSEGGLAKSDNLDAIKAKIKDKGYNFAYAYDGSGKIGRAFGAVVTPQTFVLDKNRVIRYTGAIDDNQNEAKAEKPYLKNAIDAVLANETVEIAETRAQGCGISYGK